MVTSTDTERVSIMATTTILWTAPQSCGDCGTEAAFVRQSDGAAICRECGHEHPMDTWNLDMGERFEWVGGDHGEWPAVLYVTAEDPS